MGTVLVWLPLVLPILLSAAALLRWGLLRFDYLLPAELFPLALVGGALLLWAALRARAYRGLIGGGLGVATGSLVTGQLLAVVTGLASGATEPVGWRVVVVLGAIVLYALALAVVGVGGVLLLRRLFTPAART